MEQEIKFPDNHLLIGHTSMETAKVVDDYPYGFTLRCKIRYWIEYKPKHGFRSCSQTTNPKKHGEPWNKPKCGQYTDVLFMYEEAETGHVKFFGGRFWSEQAFAKIVNWMINYDSVVLPEHIAAARQWYISNTAINHAYRVNCYEGENKEIFTKWTTNTIDHIKKCEFKDLLNHPKAPKRDNDEHRDGDWYIGNLEQVA